MMIRASLQRSFAKEGESLRKEARPAEASDSQSERLAGQPFGCMLVAANSRPPNLRVAFHFSLFIPDESWS
jgi:hypothetical protein